VELDGRVDELRSRGRSVDPQALRCAGSSSEVVGAVLIHHRGESGPGNDVAHASSFSCIIGALANE
jgi:hypothetical protein